MNTLFIKFDGIEGNATAEKYTGWSLIHSVHFTINRQFNSQVGKTNNRMKGHPSFSDFTIMKYSDKSTNQLLQLMCIGSLIAKVEIHCMENELEPFEKFKLENVFIANFEKTVIGGSDSMEILKLDFTTIHHIYTPRDEKNQSTAPISGGYDLGKMAVI